MISGLRLTLTCTIVLIQFLHVTYYIIDTVTVVTMTLTAELSVVSFDYCSPLLLHCYCHCVWRLLGSVVETEVTSYCVSLENRLDQA